MEIIDFFPTKRDDKKQLLQGTMTVRFKHGDAYLEIRGIGVFKKKNNWWFNMPQRKGLDPTSGESVTYPVFSFQDRERGKKFFEQMIDKGKRFIIAKHCTNTMHPVPGSKVDSVHNAVESIHKTVESVHKKEEPPKIEEMPIQTSKKSFIMEWKDPPVRKNQSNVRKNQKVGAR